MSNPTGTAIGRNLAFGARFPPATIRRLSRIPIGRWLANSIPFRVVGPLFCVYLLASVGYARLFNLEVGRNRANIGGVLFTRIYLPDSEVYELVRADEAQAPNWLSRLSGDVDIPGDPNIYWISRFAAAIHELDVSPLYVNAALVLTAALASSALLSRLGFPSWPALALFLLNPATIYYSQTITKEIVLLALTALLGYAFCVESRSRRALVMIPIVACAVMIRAQEGVALLLASIASLFPVRFTKRAFHVFLLLICIALPTMYATRLIDVSAADNYREAAPSVSGLAEGINFGLRNIPLFGYLGLPIRAFQNITEPFPTFRLQDIYGLTSINTYVIVLVGNFFVTGYAFLRLCTEILTVLVGRVPAGPKARILFLAAAQLVVVSANPFCHNRYIFNLIALLGIAPRPRGGDSSPTWRRIPGYAWALVASAYGGLILYSCLT